MARSNKTSDSKASAGRNGKGGPATLRSTSGAGFDFEDLISAWQMVKALSGVQAPGIDGVITQVQAQVSTLGWQIDDLLLTAQDPLSPRRLAISAKGNPQVTAAGLPSDFVTRAWDQWRDSQGPFNRTTDCLALFTVGTHPTFDPAWREVKNACSGADAKLTMSRIRANKKQSVVFDSVQKPGGASDEDTIELIRCLQVVSTDLHFEPSDTVSQAIGQCRRLLASGKADEGKALWEFLTNTAKEIRLQSGTVTVMGLLSKLRGKFELRHHPDYERDWETLSHITEDYKTRIETELPSGYVVQRTSEQATLQSAIAGHQVTVVFGDSGLGKSALVKSALDNASPSWSQVWFGPEELKTALSAASRSALPLSHELSQVLNATVKPHNVLVIDSAERIDSREHIVVRRLLQAILPSTGEVSEAPWRIVIITQAQSWGGDDDPILNGQQAHHFEVDPLKSDDVKLALQPSHSLAWLVAHDDTIAALRNLRTLAWVIKAGAAMRSTATDPVTPMAVADRLWIFWTKNQPDVQALMMRLANREASFERSFPLTNFDSAETATLKGRPAELPLRLNKRTNRIEFEHDLAADWSRFQFLKQISNDTPQWAALASNPLWTNALRMHGQFLLRESAENGTAWDVAFDLAEKEENKLAGDILLDALCLDPDAERFLTERADFLISNDAKYLSRLLRRFHHIATMPAASGLGLNSAVDLYIEAGYRSPIIGRWGPVLRFMSAHRHRLKGLVSAALAKVIHTWLTKTPLRAGAHLVPFRKELVEIALGMARTVQVEKASGVIYSNCDPLLYTAPLAGAADLPVEVGNWALELAGRREVDVDVMQLVSEVQLQKVQEHKERLKTDAVYKARNETRRQAAPTLGSYRERLPAWPLGARAKVDRDFSKVCFKDNALGVLMQEQPATAAEILLALIIDDEPEREYRSNYFEVDLGLKYQEDAYPTAFWKSPFFNFLQIAPETALTSLIALVNFCTERWVAQMMKRHAGEIPCVTLELMDGVKKAFPGWHDVFGWPQSNDSMRNGNLYCALDALERWLTRRLEAGEDVTTDIERILREGNSASLISVLINVAKHSPALLRGPLAALMTFPNLFFWDNVRVDRLGHNFVSWSWVKSGQSTFNFARDWTLAPHRQKRFLQVVVDLLLTEDNVAQRLQELVPTWNLPEDPKEALQFRMFFAALDRSNYQACTDHQTGEVSNSLVYPEDLVRDAKSWQSSNEQALTFLWIPEQCEQWLQSGKALQADQAANLFKVLKDCESVTPDEDNDAKTICKFAAACTLVAAGGEWLEQNPIAQKHAIALVRSGVTAVASTGNDLRVGRIGRRGEELKFVAYAVMRLWLTNEIDREWEVAVLRILTSGESQATAIVIAFAYVHREQLGTAWWRLLRAGLFWSGLLTFAPHHSDDNGAEKAWNIWLGRLRRFPLRGVDANPEMLDFKRIVDGLNRLDFQRRTRRYNAGNEKWLGKPKRKPGVSLNDHFLEALFGWLLESDGTGDLNLDIRLTLRLWDYEATRAKARSKKHGEYDLPGQHLGYSTLLKLAAMSIAAPKGEDRAIWEPVLSQGPGAHYALQHFIRSLFQRLGKDDDPVAFERVWRAMAEYGVAADWNQPYLWYHGERLICDLLGFGNEDALSLLQPDAALRMQDLYKGWADTHLSREEECVTRFCRFLTSDFGAPLRFDGLCWIASMLKDHKPSSHWYHKGMGDALLELVAETLASGSQALAKKAQARQAVIEIAAELAAMNVSGALALQERIKLLR